MMTGLPVSLDTERDLIDPIVQLLRWLKLFAIVYPSFANPRSPRTERTVRAKLP